MEKNYRTITRIMLLGIIDNLKESALEEDDEGFEDNLQLLREAYDDYKNSNK